MQDGFVRRVKAYFVLNMRSLVQGSGQSRGQTAISNVFVTTRRYDLRTIITPHVQPRRILRDPTIGLFRLPTLASTEKGHGV